VQNTVKVIVEVCIMLCKRALFNPGVSQSHPEWFWYLWGGLKLDQSVQMKWCNHQFSTSEGHFSQCFVRTLHPRTKLNLLTIPHHLTYRCTRSTWMLVKIVTQKVNTNHCMHCLCMIDSISFKYNLWQSSVGIFLQPMIWIWFIDSHPTRHVSKRGFFFALNLLCRFFYSWRQHIYSFDWENIWKLCLYTMNSTWFWKSKHKKTLTNPV